MDNSKILKMILNFWKYAVRLGAKDNCELKLWSCETWECIQTLRFTSPNSHSSAAKNLKQRLI
uniref:Enhancer of mrna-decapping protein 4-like protein isoform x1 n=1 Tax=Triatoma infestans TaxID=30076 RepID=A0A170WM35_TRIIF